MNLRVLAFLFIAILISCASEEKINPEWANPTLRERHLNLQMDAWHLAASEARLKDYFSVCAEDFVFLGTDSTERWTKSEFYSFCKPYFDKGKAWDFRVVKRYWNFSQSGKVAWFDESLSTWMEDCRGSGVVELIDGKWLLKHYNLSITVPNDLVDSLNSMKSSYYHGQD
ncbi:MAG: nuclear transport factor 2 family protein [Luteibaculum sp.]